MRTGKRIFIFHVIFLAGVIPLRAQTRISGFVRDESSGEALVGAQVVENNRAVATNNHGYFSTIITVPAHLLFSYTGYSPLTLDIVNSPDTLITVSLQEYIELEEVVVKARRTSSFNSTTLSRAEMINTPSLGGKPDVMKVLQLQPGIQSQNEGSSLLLVRGGNPGENLYLLDNVPLIYVNHIGGFMSVFNPDMINNVTLYKGGFPARYGSKLSSIVDIAQREGDNLRLKGSYSVGVTDASFTLEGPLKMKNTTFILNGRKTFTDLLYLLVCKIDPADYNISYGFHDLNGKFSWKPDAKNSLHLNIYQGDDYLNFWTKSKDTETTEKGRIGNIWGNWLGSVRWNHVISPRLFASTSLSYTRYRLKDINKYSTSDNNGEVVTGNKYTSSVQDISIRSEWKYALIRNWTLDYGVHSAFLMHNPNQIYSFENGSQGLNPLYAYESCLYLDNTVLLPWNIEGRIGLRTVNYSAKEHIDTKLEPRINIDFGIHQNHTLNFSYMQVNQFSHLIFTSETFLNNEVWVPADKDIAPAWSQQYTAGWKGYFHEQLFQAGIELYYKDLKNLTTYREGYTSLMGDGNWRAKVVSEGRGTAYGIEFSLRKNYGKLTGFMNYSYSKAVRQFPFINDGEEYIYEYDRPHCGSVGINWQLKDKLTFSADWVYQTGLPYTPAIGRQYTPHPEIYAERDQFYYEALIYGDRNSARMKDYHRLDLSLQYARLTKKRKMKSVWSFNLYNAYNRQNPYYYYYNSGNSGEIFYPSPQYDYWKVKLYQVSFFPILPSISYKVYFDTGLSKDEKSWKKRSESYFNKWLYQKKSIRDSVSSGSYIKKRLNFKVGYARYATGSYSDDRKITTGNYRIESNYGILKFLETGVYAGYTRYEYYPHTPWDTNNYNGYTMQYNKTFLYGVNCNFHPLTFLVKRNDFRFDLYLTGKFGDMYFSKPIGFYLDHHHFKEYSVGCGLGYYLGKHIGLYTEYSYGKFLYGEKSKFRYGLTFKF